MKLLLVGALLNVARYEYLYIVGAIGIVLSVFVYFAHLEIWQGMNPLLRFVTILVLTQVPILDWAVIYYAAKGISRRSRNWATMYLIPTAIITILTIPGFIVIVSLLGIAPTQEFANERDLQVSEASMTPLPTSTTELRYPTFANVTETPVTSQPYSSLSNCECPLISDSLVSGSNAGQVVCASGYFVSGHCGKLFDDFAPYTCAVGVEDPAGEHHVVRTIPNNCPGCPDLVLAIPFSTEQPTEEYESDLRRGVWVDVRGVVTKYVGVNDPSLVSYGLVADHTGYIRICP